MELGRRASVVGLFALAITSLTAAGAAGQSDPPPGELHCAWKLEPVGPGDVPGVTETVSVPLGCFTSASEAIAVGTGGVVRIPDDLAGDRLTQEILDEFGAQAASSFLIGREYDNTNYVNLIYEAFAPGPCTATSGWEVGYVGDALNDRFESGKGFSNCNWNYKYEHSQFRGARLECNPNCSTYGALRNQVSSLKWLGFRLG